jgi:hypothetical protein
MTAYRLQSLDDEIKKLTDQLLGTETHMNNLEQRAAALSPLIGGQNPANYGRKLFKRISFTKTKSTMTTGSKNLGIAEVVDTLTDAIKLFDRFAGVLADGFQFMDAMVVLAEFPVLQELYNDRKTFWAELTDLSNEESEQVYAQVAANTGTAVSNVAKRAKAALDFAADAYGLVEDTVVRGKRIFEKAKLVVAKAS